MRFRFDADPHEYRLGEQLLPSVTEVLSGTGLLRDHTYTDEFYRERGSAVHSAIQLHLLGQLDDASVDEHVRPFLERFQRFEEAVSLEPMLLEQPLYCPTFLYAGTPDFFGLMNDQPVLLDWKSGSYEPGFGIQVAGGYLPLVEAAAEQELVPFEAKTVYQARVGVVCLTRELPGVTWIDPLGQREVFRSALAVYNWRHTYLKGVAA